MANEVTTRGKTAQADTATRLLRAAMQEFQQRGYAGTDSNRIARHAGFSPQTFYRWYEDKTAIFIAAYRAWEEEEMTALAALAAADAPATRLAEAIIRHHRRHLRFRRSLRQLAAEIPAVRQARAESRRRQVERIRSVWKLPSTQAAPLLIRLLQIERLADAAAERELQDLGLSQRQLRDAIAALIGKPQEPGR